MLKKTNLYNNPYKMKTTSFLFTLLLTFDLVGQTGTINKPAPTEEKPILTEKPNLPNTPIPDKPNPPSEEVKEALDEPLVDYKLQLENQVAENDSLKKRISSLEAKIDLMDSEIELVAGMKKEETRLLSVISDLEGKLATVKTEKNNYFSKLTESNNQTIALQNKINELESTIAGISNSATLVFDGWSYIPDVGWIFLSDETFPYFYVSKRGWAFFTIEQNEKLIFLFDEQKWMTLKK